ncbi:uncharacterized protein LOC135930059 [Gordionus sp. m RMFG-2023]|uniref:uncharacterized protein LOC135930059 n=1 Tax=Gordionus sp. m RMFG-2023 TaxID=3053472 RepID=UPI0031FCCEB6
MTKDDKSKFDEIQDYILYQKYPSSMSSNKGLRRNLRVQASRYKICKGKMHHHSHNGEVVLDLDRRIQLLQMVHSGCDTNVSAISLAAHFGITKTYSKLADSETILDCNRRV